MLVKDIWADAKSSRGFGNCDPATLYSAISDSVRVLANKVREWDWMIGTMTICAEDGYLTLPRDVETPLAINVDGSPAWSRDKWFVHHINGPGCGTMIDCFNKFWDEVEDVCTFRQPPNGTYLLGVPEEASDEGKQMLVYGYDIMDKELYHTDGGGKIVKGVRVPITAAAIPAFIDTVIIKKVTRVVKGETDGGVHLWAVDPMGAEESVLIGYYYPDEVEPKYRQIRVKAGGEVMMTYRRKTMDVKTQNDWIPFESKLALLLMLQSLRKVYSGDLGGGQAFEEKAVDLLRNEEMSKKVRTSIGPQVRNFSSNNNERLRGRGR